MGALSSPFVEAFTLEGRWGFLEITWGKTFHRSLFNQLFLTKVLSS